MRVALIFGGVSSEHEISCLTAGGVAREIDRDRFEVVGVGIAKTGRWVRVPLADMAAMDVVGHSLPVVDPGLPEAVLLRGDARPQVATRVGDELVDVEEFDVAFSLLHGPFGEDGTIQGMFELLGARYVGAGVAASAIGMDKDLMKRSMSAAGLPVGPWVAFGKADWQRDAAGWAAKIGALGYPVFAKPARGGSSVGISRVDEAGQLGAAVEAALAWDPKVVVEKGVMGAREIEVAVIEGRDGGAPRASLPGEIVIHQAGAFYDFDAKYLPGEQVSLEIPAALGGDETALARELAVKTFELMRVEGLARVDLFLLPGGRALVNELNTMPGFTRHSMFPSLWQASGLGYRELVSELIDLAMARPMGLR